VTQQKLLVVSPVRDEALHIERTARAVAAQRRPPDLWVVIDDGSSDGTLELARELAAEIPFMRVMTAPQRSELRTARDALAVAKEARAFNHALAAVGIDGYTHVGKLDGDVELPPEWFEELLAAFADDPSLGIAGGRLVEPTPEDEWRLLRIPDYHVHGAVKLYGRDCFDAIGGVPERLGWDTIDETYARMRGFRTHSYASLVARHHRHWGSADGRLRGRARHGECAYIVRYPLPWILARSVKVAAAPPLGLSGAAFVYGYLRARAAGAPKVDDPEFRRFVRRELRGRYLAARRARQASSESHPNVRK
jgi:glycosyltransferase involved in cell wall biosynthesis